MSKRVFLRIAYDGTNYHGWQIQDNGITVEAVPIPECMHWGMLRYLIRTQGFRQIRYLLR